jgi:hypothetical protein
MGEPEPADVVLTEEAKALWVTFYNQHAQEPSRNVRGSCQQRGANWKDTGHGSRL